MLLHYLDAIESRILTESQNYIAMFNDFVGTDATAKQAVEKYVTWARKTLKKNDRIVWFLRWVRIELAGRARHTNSDAELAKLNKRLHTEHTRSDVVPLNNLMTNLEHYLSMPIPQIQNMVWAKQSPSELLDDFDAYEEEWKEASNARLLKYQEGSEPRMIMKFPDGYAWFDLEKPYCRDEGGAMGHCGNTAAYKRSDTLLSLRRLVKTVDGHTQWYPVCTFILDENGQLGEMKGRNNDKPLEKYHPYIVELLKHEPSIEGIKGGGYLASHNFHMSDLDDETREELVAQKPGLAELWDLYRKEGMTARVLSRMKTGLDANGLDYYSYDPKAKEFVVETWRDFDTFLGSIYDEPMEELLKIAQGNADWQEDRGTPEEDFVKMALELPPSWQEQLLQRAEMPGQMTGHHIEEAARRLIITQDEWFRVFEQVHEDSDEIREKAWERLFEYAQQHWSFAATHCWVNVPTRDYDEFRAFVESNQEVKMLCSERDMVAYASTNDDDDDDYEYDIMRMRGDGGSPSWDTIDTDYNNENRREEKLTDRQGNDLWLKNLSEDGDLMEDFIAALQGSKRSSGAIRDPRQQELSFESMRRHMNLVS